VAVEVDVAAHVQREALRASGSVLAGVAQGTLYEQFGVLASRDSFW
jgi:hypothetical protein